MNYYETLYIIHPALEAGRLKDIIISVEDSLKKMGGEPLAVELWGKRKLSHYIAKQKYGTYVLLQYNGKEKCTGNFAVELEHNPNILAYLTTNINQDDVLEQEEDLDTQIAGKTRESERMGPSKEETIKKTIVSEDGDNIITEGADSSQTTSQEKLEMDAPTDQEDENKKENSDRSEKVELLSGNSDDMFKLILNMERCKAVSLSLDYLNRLHQRELTVITEENSYYIDLTKNIFSSSNSKDNFLEKFDNKKTYFDQHIDIIKNEGRRTCKFQSA